MWRVKDGVFYLVDFVGDYIGMTSDGGKRIGFATATDYGQYIKDYEGVPLVRFEEGWFVHCDKEGRSEKEPISVELSVQYIYEQLMTGL
jgi:hypothetical protein